MNLLEACAKLEKELKEIYKLDIDIVPTSFSKEELGFIMTRVEGSEEQNIIFSFDPYSKMSTQKISDKW